MKEVRVIRPSQADGRRCPKCATHNSAGRKNCVQCSHAFYSIHACPHCGRENPITAHVCLKCWRIFSEKPRRGFDRWNMVWFLYWGTVATFVGSASYFFIRGWASIARLVFRGA
jgi:predicted amidophosphoribosyltransferase